jgi:putative glutamine amidotransferase
MPRPLIGVTTSVSIDQHPERAYVNTSYLRAVQEAGGVPVLLPPQFDAASRQALWHRIDGLLLTGGGDIDPSRFGAERHPTVIEVSPARDALEIGLTVSAIEEAVPLFAICRGVQVLNVALGGTLWQDIPSGLDTPIAHSQKEPRDQPTHAVSLSDDAQLAAIVGAREIVVNSMHHQALRRLGRGLTAVGWSPDGVIEAVELRDARALVTGVQWHPEELVHHDAAARALFRSLIEAAARPRAPRGPAPMVSAA